MYTCNIQWDMRDKEWSKSAEWIQGLQFRTLVSNIVKFHHVVDFLASLMLVSLYPLLTSCDCLTSRKVNRGTRAVVAAAKSSSAMDCRGQSWRGMGPGR